MSLLVRPLPPAILVCVVFASCSRQTHQTDASNIKTQVLHADQEAIHLPLPAFDVAHLDQHADDLVKIVNMSGHEFALRAKSFRLSSETSIQIQQNQSSRHFWQQASSGHFSINHESAQNSVQWRVIDQQAFVRHNQGPWRTRSFHLEDAPILQSQVTCDLSELFRLFAQDFHVSSAVTATLSGHTAYRYKIDSTNHSVQKAHFLDHEVEPLTLKGSFVIDAQRAVILTADLTAVVAILPMPPPSPSAVSNTRFQSPPPEHKIRSTVHLQWQLELAVNDKDLEPKVPQDALVEVMRHRPDANLLDFWQKPRGTHHDETEEEE